MSDAGGSTGSNADPNRDPNEDGWGQVDAIAKKETIPDPPELKNDDAEEVAWYEFLVEHVDENSERRGSVQTWWADLRLVPVDLRQKIREKSMQGSGEIELRGPTRSLPHQWKFGKTEWTAPMPA